MSTNNVTVTVNTNPLPPSPPTATTQPTVSSDVQLEARKRLADLKAKEDAILNEAKFKAQQEADLKAFRQREEEIKLESEKLVVRMEAEKAVVARQAKKAVEEREALVAAEIERLKSRTPLEILQEEVTSLRNELTGIKSLLVPTRS
jgi:hypothetical protein